MKKRYSIIFASQDAGGFTAIMPVILRFLKEKHEVAVLLAGDSRKIAKRSHISYVDAGRLKQPQINKLIEKNGPDVILTSTSFGLSLEKKITVFAKKMSIPVVAMVDYWANYHLRFSAPGKRDLNYLPDLVGVIDLEMKNQMVRQGFPAQKIVVTGNPFFDTLKSQSSGSVKFILFASQPYSELPKINNPLNFNEVKILSDIFDVFNSQKTIYPFCICLHPKEKKLDKFNRVIGASRQNVSLSTGSVFDLIPRSRLVIGINSMVLMQAALMGKPVISYQPGINKKNDLLFSNKIGLTNFAGSKRALALQIKKNFSKSSTVKAKKNILNKYLLNHSTDKVINLMKSLIK